MDKQDKSNKFTDYSSLQQNCFSTDTKFITSEGVMSFKDFKDNDHVVIKGDTTWKDATVKYFGKEEIFKLKVKRGESIREIETTLNHKWILSDAEGNRIDIALTAELEEGDLLKQTHDYNGTQQWEVVEVSYTVRIDDVWCIVEPEYDEFTLENGILTKGCTN